MNEPQGPRVASDQVSLLLPDAASTGALVLAQAMEYCAQKMGLPGAQAAIDSLKHGDRTACSYCHYSMAKQVAESLGTLDDNVRAVYVFEYDETPNDESLAQPVPVAPLHLIAWVRTKTAALTSLAEGLDRALVQALAEAVGLNRKATVLDIQVVDDRDVEKRMGYGALLAALHNRPLKVWER